MDIERSNKLSIKDFNFTDLQSELINNLKEDNNDFNCLDITIDINKQDLTDFNNRVVTPKNINNIIKICDYFLIDNAKDFLIKNAVPTLERYKVDNYELSTKPKYILPLFMTKGMSIVYYNKLQYETELFENEEGYLVTNIFNNYLSSFSNSIQEMASLNLINWIEFYIKNMKDEYESIYKDDFSIIFVDATKYAAFHNNKECLQYLHNNNIDEYESDTATAAAYKNNLDLLKFLHQQNCPWNVLTCAAAANTGSLECLKYAYENGCKMDWLTLSEAARNGHINCIKYALENGCLFDTLSPIDYESACVMASCNNQLNSFKFCIANGCDIQLSLLNAARHGNVQMVKYIYENHYTRDNIDDDYGINILSRCAIKSGDLETLKYTHQIIKSPLLEKDEMVFPYQDEEEKEHCTLIAATSEKSDVLNYLLENNIELDEDALEYALNANSEKCVDYILNLPSDMNKICIDNEENNYISIAMNSNNLSLLKKMYEFFPKHREQVINPDDCYECENFECWNFLINKKIKFNKILTTLIDKRYLSRWISSFEYIKIHEKLKILWDYELPELLGYYGQYELLKYVVEKGCLVNKGTLLNICTDNYHINNVKLDYIPNKLACLKYALENNFDYNCYLCDKCSDKKIIKFIISKNIKLNNNIINSNLYKKNIEIVDLLIKLGYEPNFDTLSKTIEYYYYTKYKTNFIKTHSNIENEDNIYYKRLVYYLSICPKLSLSSSLFHLIIDRDCFEIFPELIKVKCPVHENFFPKLINKLNMKHHDFLIWLFKLIIKNYNVKLTEKLLYLSNKTIYLPHFKNFLIENKCEGYEKYTNNNTNIEYDYKLENSYTIFNVFKDFQ